MMIAKIRRARGLTQMDLAALVGVEQASISRAERGFEGTTLRMINAIAGALEVHPSLLIADEYEEAEQRLLIAYRALPAEQRKGWMQLVQALSGTS